MVLLQHVRSVGAASPQLPIDGVVPPGSVSCAELPHAFHEHGLVFDGSWQRPSLSLLPVRLHLVLLWVNSWGTAVCMWCVAIHQGWTATHIQHHCGS